MELLRSCAFSNWVTSDGAESSRAIHGKLNFLGATWMVVRFPPKIFY